MTSKTWSILFGLTLIPIAVMIIAAFVGNTVLALICLAISLIAFFMARVVEMKGIDLIIIWICGIISLIFGFV